MFHESRREFIRLASGVGLSFLLPGIDVKAANKRGSERPKSMITLWLSGGPSQLETWDAHPDTSAGGPTKAIKTKLPGLQFADHYPQTAEVIDSMSVIRSLVSKEGDHERGTYYLKTGYRPVPALKHPSIGAILTHQLSDSHIEIPQHISLCNSQWPSRGGFLGAEYDAFKVFAPGENLANMRVSFGKDRKKHPENDRQKRRLANLDVLSRSFRQGRRAQTERTLHQETIARALKMMRSEQLQAFEIKDEPVSKRKAYGDTSFGKGCLIARRLVEQGVRAVEVTLNGFDSHTNNFNAHRENGEILDPAFATLITDLKERDLLDSTVVLCIGEFGRTPNINTLDGRDHWPSGFSCVLGGGGLKSGIVIGETDPEGAKKKPNDPIQIQDLYATIFKTMNVDFQKEIISPIGRPMKFSEGTPISRLL